MKILVFAIFSFVLFLPFEVNAQNNSQETAEINNVLNMQVESWNNGSIEGFMKGYWKSPELTFVSGANVTKGWQETLDRYKRSYESKEKMGTLSFTELQIEILGKKAAVVTGKWSLKRAVDNPNGRFTLIFRKFKEGWRIVHDHTS